MFGINDGGSGRVGGPGIIGIVGNEYDNDNPFIKSKFNHHIISRFISIFGGSGRFGNCGNGILIGTKFIFGNIIFIPSSICDISI